ncbi:MAG TPA: hypothetical protein VK923_14160 [Euzebyales bacterium]|nr:hypothetical protein [Euzebyales bacterium]
MLFPKVLWPGLANGSVQLAFRRWRRPTVRAGGTLRSPVGVLAIDEVRAIEPCEITDADAVRAGHADRQDVLDALQPGADRTLYRIAFHVVGDDPRIVLRSQADLGDADIVHLADALDRLDAASADGAWTRDVLEQIARRPSVRAPDLAAEAGQETLRFKRRVRRLKELGLTESLRIGYRLSPRGRALLRRLRAG